MTSALNALVDEQTFEAIPEQAAKIATALESVAAATLAYTAADEDMAVRVGSAVTGIDWVDAQCVPLTMESVSADPRYADVLHSPNMVDQGRPFDPMRFASRVPGKSTGGAG